MTLRHVILCYRVKAWSYDFRMFVRILLVITFKAMGSEVNVDGE